MFGCTAAKMNGNARTQDCQVLCAEDFPEGESVYALYACLHHRLYTGNRADVYGGVAPVAGDHASYI